MDDDQQFCLRWNNHQSTLISVFDTLLEKGIHVDCTLAAEGQTLKAHKVVLSACSPYFEAVLSQQYDKHPIIILKDVKFAELRAMMDYMYRGEVNISQDQLGALLKAAESLQIKGLSDSKPPAPPPPVTHTTVPRAVSPPPKVSPGSPCAEERSREGSLSPLRRKRKKRRASLSPVPPPAIIPPALPLLLNNNPATPPDDCMAKLKLLQPEQAAAPASPAPAPSLEPATLEPKADEDQPTEDEGDSEGEHAGTSHSLQDSTGFSWHLDRSQDEMSLGTDGQRDTTGRVTLPCKPERTWISGNRMQDNTIIDLDILGESDCDSSVSSMANTNEYIKVENLADFQINKKFKIEYSIDSKMNENVKVDNLIGSQAKESKKKKNSSDKNMDINKYVCNKYNSLPCGQYYTPNGFKCPNCQRTYNARKNLVRHINLECGREPQYKCPHCPHGNHRRNELKRHIQKKHQNIMPQSSGSPPR